MNFRVSLSCNSTRNGMFRGCFDSVHIDGPDGETILTLEGPAPRVEFALQSKCGAPPAFCLFVRLKGATGWNRFWFCAEGYRQWFGNWCWDMFPMRADETARFARVLRKAGWDCMEAESSLFDLWKSGERLEAEHLIRTATHREG